MKLSGIQKLDRMGPNLKIPVGNEELIALRDRLNKDNKLRSRKSTAVAASDTNLSGIVASVSKIQLVEPMFVPS